MKRRTERAQSEAGDTHQRGTMSRLLSVAVLLVYGACVLVRAQRDYGVKLCGREFIRAVIFTCGGSRWRRAGHEGLTHSAPSDPYLPSAYQQPSDGIDEPGWSHSKDLDKAEHPSFLSSSSSSSPSLNDLIQAMSEQTHTNVETNTSKEPLQEMELLSGLDTLFPSRLLWSKYFRSPDSRKKRNFSLGLAGMCCNQGCTKNDIGRLC